jgi:hypothetical protein
MGGTYVEFSFLAKLAAPGRGNRPGRSTRPWHLTRLITRVNTFVCLGCGRVKQYVDDLDELRRYAESHPEGLTW